MTETEVNEEKSISIRSIYFFASVTSILNFADLSNIHETTITPFPYSTAVSTGNRKN